MNLRLIGCSHHQSSVAVRERLAFTESQIPSMLNSFYDRFPESEAVLLSTCNRTEFYAAAQDAQSLPSRDELVALLANQIGLTSQEIDADLFTHYNRQAIEHLFTVAASLDSMVIGEAQILSQVKRAYQLAVETNQTIPLTHQVFQSAIRVARRISNETDIHSNRVSVPSVAIGVLAKQIFERLDNKKILVIGAGEMAEETLKYIVADGGNDIVITNRTLEKSEELANQFQANVLPFSQLEQALAQSDLIVSTTGATEPVVTNELFSKTESIRKQKPLFILDLAIPRDFEKEIGQRLNVYLYTLDDLQLECEQNLRSRQSQYPKALKIIQHETDRFFGDLERRSRGSTIAQLKRQADEIKAMELKRLSNRLDGVDQKQLDEIEQFANRLVNKILHPPLKSLQNDDGNSSGGLLDALKKLFQLGD